ncbi:MAG: hypothetical protein BGO07_00225 [Alphaproteobacteria bacterium 40-19]|nr:MAG: hypothetical protein BGO07_00225 [Alphaproteobacteria bacterium 40-19]
MTFVRVSRALGRAIRTTLEKKNIISFLRKKRTLYYCLNFYPGLCRLVFFNFEYKYFYFFNDKSIFIIYNEKMTCKFIKK